MKRVSVRVRIGVVVRSSVVVRIGVVVRSSVVVRIGVVVLGLWVIFCLSQILHNLLVWIKGVCDG